MEIDRLLDAGRDVFVDQREWRSVITPHAAFIRWRSESLSRQHQQQQQQQMAVPRGGPASERAAACGCVTNAGYEIAFFNKFTTKAIGIGTAVPAALLIPCGLRDILVDWDAYSRTRAPISTG